MRIAGICATMVAASLEAARDPSTEEPSRGVKLNRERAREYFELYRRLGGMRTITCASPVLN